jgi:hypothetical protein
MQVKSLIDFLNETGTMKQPLLIMMFAAITTSAFSQEEKNDPAAKTGFNINNMYIGGGINVGAGNRSFAIGVLPEVGYSITKWLDAGVSFNLNYQTQKLIDAYTGSVYAKYRTFTYGGGTFLRIWPVEFLHLTVQPEYNWIKATLIDVYSNQKSSNTLKAESVLVGIGYGNRQPGRQLSYITLMIDLAHNINSPYRDQYNHAQPVIRTGLGFYLRKKK